MTVEFVDEPIDVDALPSDPMVLFRDWHGRASATEPWHGNAMTLATSDGAGWPSARIVLLRGVDAEGFHFFTNYRSRKGRDLEGRPACALVFWWPTQVRQVRIEGTTEHLPEADSDAYFATRSRESQLGAWASPQSQSIASREELAERLARAEARFCGQPVPRPAEWGGFRVRPVRMEFWQGGAARLHDRLCYTRLPDASADWCLVRLAP